MSAAPNKKPSLALGLILILLLLAAVIFGGIWVVQAAFTPRMSDAKAAAEAGSTPAKEPTVQAEPVVQEPDPQKQPAQQPAEQTTESRVTLMALGDDLIHNCVYWSAQTPVQQTEPAVQEPEPQEQPAQQPAEQTAESRVTLMALGDDLIHNCVYWSAQTPEGGYDFTSFFDDIRPTVRQYDLACINQETILVKDRELIESYPVFGSPIEVADALADTGFNVVTFASNHCFDKKETGITDTLSYFHETYPEITTLGIHDTEADAEAISIVEKNGIRIAMLNFTYGLNNSMPEKRWMIDMLSSQETVCGRIEQAKQAADFVIVFPHWGTEDTFSPDNDQLTWAQAMADAGADLIIGGHTHTLQPVELLTASDGRDVPVYYSLGNFLSHQKEKMNLLGGMASVTIVKDADGTHVSEYDLKPTINVILRNENTGWYTYRPMLLDSYGTELAAQNRFSECTVDAMWALYEDITG